MKRCEDFGRAALASSSQAEGSTAMRDITVRARATLFASSTHWRWVVMGKGRVTYADGTTEIISAGQAYCLPPGHSVEIIEPVEVVESSPSEEYEVRGEGV